MILGVGTDLVTIERMAALIENQSFLDKVFSKEEQTQALSRPSKDRRACFYATRFAAKEACAKALGTGIRDGVTFVDMVVSNDSLGKPLLTLHGGAKKRLNAMAHGAGVRIDLSLSDEYPMALAFVIISRE